MIDITKPVKTRNGVPVTIIYDKSRFSYDGLAFPLIGYIGEETFIYSWTKDGKISAYGQAKNDLVQEQEVWINVYDNGHLGIFQNYEDAHKSSLLPIARIRVPYTVGQFDKP